MEVCKIALRRESNLVTHEAFLDAVLEMQANKKVNLNYYAQFVTEILIKL